MTQDFIMDRLDFVHARQSCCPASNMVFCYQNCSSDREKLLKFEAEGREFAKFLRSLEPFNSERSEQFLVTECSLLEQLEFKLEKIIGI